MSTAATWRPRQVPFVSPLPAVMSENPPPPATNSSSLTRPAKPGQRDISAEAAADHEQVGADVATKVGEDETVAIEEAEHESPGLRRDAERPDPHLRRLEARHRQGDVDGHPAGERDRGR